MYVGIDPGKSGGLAIIDPNRDPVVTHYPMPSSPQDLWAILDEKLELESYVAHIVIEKVRSSPQMGVVSAFTFGRGYGVLLGVIATLDTPYKEETPQAWQKALRIPPRKKGKLVYKKGEYGKKRVGEETKAQFKERLRVKAQQLFPKLSIWKEPRSKGKQLAICDALLIAAYCYKLHTGNEI